MLLTFQRVANIPVKGCAREFHIYICIYKVNSFLAVIRRLAGDGDIMDVAFA
jgi:hypothetical protein